jgi:uncharacterized membrane protein
MNLPIPIGVAQYPRSVRWVMAICWVLIVVKCLLVWWAVDHWRMPFHALWIVGPTLVFAALATGSWLMHREE